VRIEEERNCFTELEIHLFCIKYSLYIVDIVVWRHNDIRNSSGTFF